MRSRFVACAAAAALVTALSWLTGCGGGGETAGGGALQFPLERTQARMERGKYLVSGVVLCLELSLANRLDRARRPA